jgi:hypothetical protein
MFERALKSVVQQSRRPDRIIVGDDGNDAAVRAICAEVASPPVQYVGRRPQHRMTDNWDFVLRSAPPGLVALLEDDNFWSRDHLRTAENILESHPQASLYHCGHREAYDDGGNLDFYKSFLPKWHTDLADAGGGAVDTTQVIVDALACGSINSSTVVLRRAILDELPPFDHRYLMGMDTLMWTRAVMRGGAVYGAYQGAVYTYHDGNVSGAESRSGRTAFQSRAARRVLLKEAWSAGQLSADAVWSAISDLDAAGAGALVVLLGHRSSPPVLRALVPRALSTRPELRSYSGHLRYSATTSMLLPYSDVFDWARQIPPYVRNQLSDLACSLRGNSGRD